MMVALTQFPSQPEREPQEIPTKKIWVKQPGEPVMWHNRLKRLLKLGPSRTMLKALQQERKQVKALKGTPGVQEPDAARVPQQVPGSWKRASVQYQWQERCQAYDNHIIDKSVNEYIDRLYIGLGAKENRVWELSELALALRDQFRHTTGVQERCLLAARIESLIREVRIEMKDYDRTVNQYVLSKQVERIYTKQPESFNPFVDLDQRERDALITGQPRESRLR